MESMLGSRRRSKKETPVLYWWFRNNCLFPSSSRTFRTQSYWSFITGQCCDSEQFLPIYLPHWMCGHSSFSHQLWINSWRSKLEQETDSILPACWSYGQRVTRILTRLTCMYHVVHNTCTVHGRDIKTQYIGSTSILLLRKDCSSIRLDRTQLFFKKHFQLIVFQWLSEWKLDKSNTKSFHVTSTSAKDLLETRMEKRTGFGSCSTTRRGSCSTTRTGSCSTSKKFQTNPTNSKSNSWKIGATYNMQNGRNTYRSQETNVYSFCQELSSSERTRQLVETDVIQTRSSEDRKSLNVEQTHDRSVRPVATLNTADAKDSSRVRSSHESDTFNVEDEVLRKRMGKSIANHGENHE